MKIHQLSLFLENKPGQLKVPCQVLSRAGVNILALSLADTESFGILRLIVKDWETAAAALKEAGHLVNVTEVLALDVPDRPGGLGEVLDVLDRAGLSIEYMYAFTAGPRGNRAAIIFRFEDPDRAMKALASHGVAVLGPIDLFGRMNA